MGSPWDRAVTARELCLPDGYDVAWFWSQVAQAVLVSLLRGDWEVT